MKRWIRINGEPFDVPLNFPKKLLSPWNIQVGYSKAREDLVSLRPTVFTKKEKSRFCKDYIYQLFRKDHIDDFQLKGNWIGLSADHVPEIYAEFSGSISGQMINCQINENSFRELVSYQKEVRKAFLRKDGHPFLTTKHGDMLDILLKMKKNQTVIDFDSMKILDAPTVYRIAAGIHTSAAPKSAIAIWHCTGRKEFSDITEKKYRPLLKELIERDFDILKYTKIEYWESFPMRVDLFTLERKTDVRTSCR